MDYTEFIDIIEDYAESLVELRKASMDEYPAKNKVMMDNYSKICKIAVKLDFSKI